MKKLVWLTLTLILPGCLGWTAGDYRSYRVTSDKGESYIVAGRDIRGMAWASNEKGLVIVSPSDVRALPFFVPDVKVIIPGKRWVIEVVE